MQELDIDSLIAPLTGGSPCGSDLEFDPSFEALQDAASAKPERQYGSTVIPAESPDWPGIRSHALALAQRTRDLRVAVWLMRSAAHVDGLPGMVAGLRLLHGLIEHHWEQVHPLPDPQDGKEPVARLNAFAALTHPGGLADVRAAALAPGRGALKVRDLELAFGAATALPGETVPTREGLTPAVVAAQALSPSLQGVMQAGVQTVRAIASLLDAKLGGGVSPDLSALRALMQNVADAGAAAQGTASASATAMPLVAPQQSPVADAPFASLAIGSREDVMRVLERACDWIERHEPNSPAPLLIQRARRLMTKSFIDIVRDMAPAGLVQVEQLAGPRPE